MTDEAQRKMCVGGGGCKAGKGGEKVKHPTVGNSLVNHGSNHPMVRTLCFSMPRAWVQALVGEL